MSIQIYTPQPSPHCSCIVSSVAFCRDIEKKGEIAAFLISLLQLTTYLALFISIVGIPLLIAIGDETRRQEEDEKAKIAFEANRENCMQNFFDNNDDPFDRVSSFLSHDDLKALATVSKGFNRIVHNNVQINEKNRWAKENGFKYFSNEKSLSEHRDLFEDLQINWNFTPQLIETLGGLFKMREIPVVEHRIETLLTDWPVPNYSIIGIKDPTTHQNCLALHLNIRASNDNPMPIVEVYQFDENGSVRGRIPKEGTEWKEIPTKILLDRLRRLIAHEPAGVILKWMLQYFLLLGVPVFEVFDEAGADSLPIEVMPRRNGMTEVVLFP